MYLLLFLISSTWAFSPLEIELLEHAKDPAAYALKIPEKSFQYEGRDIPPDVKEGCRQTFARLSATSNKSLWEAPHQGDLAANLVDNRLSMETNIRKMEDKNLTKGRLQERPWSDSYWPIANGSLAHRYVDSEDDFGTWKEHFDYFLAHPTSELIEQNKLHLLSPAEKYDLLIGDTESTLTKSQWFEGKAYWDERGEVESWMGLCHGWAAASFLMPRPTKTVNLKDASGRYEIPFYVSDVKALGTLLFAKGQVPTRFVGGRCNDKEPRTDAANRPVDTDCRDTNAATWHMSVVNQIGISKRSFVMDATYDYQVWNQPVVAYSYEYFNPETKKPEAFSKAVVKLSNLSNDPYKKFRAREAKQVVGIAMTVTYMIETTPSVDEQQEDFERSVRYLYDLELDENMKIVGGEWYNNAHPDFLWVPEKNSAPMSWFDRGMRGEWDPRFGNVNPEWLAYLKRSSQEGMPAYKIVSKLFEVSSK